MNFKYMDSVIETVDKLITNGFPKSTILYGEEGSGRKSICKYISDKLNIEMRAVDDLSNVYDFVNQVLLVVQYNKLSESNVQALLKVVEEPPEYCRIVIISESPNTTTNTIRNRCVPVHMPRYTKEELMSFTDSELVASVCKTPGMAMKLTEEYVKSVEDLCSLIISKMSVASLPNALSLSGKFNLEQGEDDKIDIGVYCDVMPLVAKQYYSENLISFFQTRFILIETEELKTNMQNPSYNKKLLFDGYIIALKEGLSQ